MEGRFERGDGELTLAKPRPIEQQQGRNSEQATMDDFYHGYNEKKKGICWNVNKKDSSLIYFLEGHGK